MGNIRRGEIVQKNGMGKKKWATYSGRHQYTEILNDAAYAMARELDDMLKV
jgi:hypothetical protein